MPGSREPGRLVGLMDSHRRGGTKVENFNEFSSLRKLLAAAAAGDEGAVKELDRRYNGLVCYFALTLLRQKGCNDPAGHSEEIISATWAAIIMLSYQLEDEDRFESWVNKIVLNLVYAHVSGDKGCIIRQNKTVQLDPTHHAEIKPTKNMIEESVLINEALNFAYEKAFIFGEIVRLHLIEGYTLQTVAKMLGESYARVRSLYYRNLNELRKFLKGGREGNDGGDAAGSPYEN
jgi:DNA-directed RNA polymerase specialized sigma24 family protein